MYLKSKQKLKERHLLSVAKTIHDPGLFLQMTIAFASVMAVFIIERIDETTGQASLFPLLIAGAGSVAYWR